MKKMKKILAMVLAMAMVLGMSLTVFATEEPVEPAAPVETTTPAEGTNNDYTGSIEIKGLAANDKTTLNVYQIIYLDKTTNEWKVVEWAKKYVDVTSDSYTITDAAGLGAAAASDSPIIHVETEKTEYTFENMAVGAYVITAAGQRATYTTMVVNNYDADTPNNVVKNEVDVTAKTSGYTLDKAAEEGDKFVARGEEVSFTITTTFPSFEVANSQDNSYKVVDTPIGLEIQRVTSVKVGSTSLTQDTDYTVSKGTSDYTINLTNYIGTTNQHAGKVVTITYTAIVTSENGYSNTANALRNETELGEGDTETGYTGDITITKYDTDEETVLSGAQFTVTKTVNAEGTVIPETDQSDILFVKVSDGVYRVALENEAGDATVEATNGTVKVAGLDAGTYHFTETVAPDGYSINEAGVTVTITENESANVSEDGSITDTKLSSLPSTGGIGTTIFTIGGCAIMVVAAGLFFATRKKSTK